jgi:D-glycero-alpha-D-manno-heptose-7-phosphate kinase
MIITRTPFRITLGGGGTDLPAYYSQYGGFIFAAAIDKFMFINMNVPIVDNLLRVKYTQSETVKHREELRHDIAKEALRMMGIEDSLEIISMADVPAGTGLGSSSCYAVGLLTGLHCLKRNYVPLEELAEEACHLEIERLKKPIGKQDQYMAVFGGLRILEIEKDGTVKTRAAKIEEETADALNRHLLMFYTGLTRSADGILAEQSRGARETKSIIVENMHEIKELGYKILEAAESGNITDIGLLFDEHWKRKKNLATNMTNPNIDEIYALAKANGALGGKISGAGGGGFFLFYVEKDHQKLKDAMKKAGLREMRFRFFYEGSKVMVNLMNGCR